MARIGTGTIIKFNAVPIGEVLDVTPPNITRGAVETSHMTTDEYHTHMPTVLLEGGDVSFEVAHDPNYDFNAAFALKAKTLLIEMPESSDKDISCSAFLTGFEPGIPFEDRMTATLTFKVTGKVTQPA